VDFHAWVVQNVRSVKRIVTQKRLREYASRYPKAKPSLEHWERVTLAAQWRTAADVKQTFNDVDVVKVGSGGRVHVFNVQWNEHRLIAAIHFNTQIVFVLRLMTHQEYDKSDWRDDL